MGTIDLPEDDYEVAYAIAITQTEIEALDTLMKADRETPYLQGPGSDLILEALDKNPLTGDQTWSELMEEYRERIRPIIHTWRAQITDEIDVVYLPIEADTSLRRFMNLLEARAENTGDPFELPDTERDLSSLFRRIEQAKNDDKLVFVPRDELPNHDEG